MTPKRWIAGVLAATVATAAMAQVRPHFDFKGITATTTLAEATPKLRSVDAYMGTNKGGKLIDDLVNGHPANINAVFDNQGLLVMHGYPLDYTDTKAAFTMKWGKPNQTVGTPQQNGFGAKIVSETVVWLFAEGRMTLTDGSFRGRPSFSYESDRQIKFLEERNKVKVDF